MAIYTDDEKVPMFIVMKGNVESGNVSLVQGQVRTVLVIRQPETINCCLIA